MPGRAALFLTFCTLLISVGTECPKDIESLNLGCVDSNKTTTDDVGKETTNSISRCFYAYRKQDGTGWDLENAVQYCSCYNQNSTRVMSNIERLVVARAINKTSPPAGLWLNSRKHILKTWMTLTNSTMETTDLLAANNDRSKECAFVIKENNAIKIKPEKCSQGHFSICRNGGCDMEQTGCIHALNTAASWYDSRFTCRAMGMELLTLYEGEKINVLDKLSILSSVPQPFWIGVRKSLWMWNNTEEILNYTWAADQPSANDENCMSLRPDAFWEDVTCSSNKLPLCWNETVSGSPSSSVSKRVGAIVGGCIGAFVGVVLIIAIVAFIFLRKKPVTVREVEMRMREKHVEKRKTELQADGRRYSDISDNLNLPIDDNHTAANNHHENHNT